MVVHPFSQTMYQTRVPDWKNFSSTWDGESILSISCTPHMSTNPYMFHVQYLYGNALTMGYAIIDIASFLMKYAEQNKILTLSYPRTYHEYKVAPDSQIELIDRLTPLIHFFSHCVLTGHASTRTDIRIKLSNEYFDIVIMNVFSQWDTLTY